MSPLGLRAHSTSHDRLLKDNFDLRFKISCLEKMIDQMDGENFWKIGKTLQTEITLLVKQLN